MSRIKSAKSENARPHPRPLRPCGLAGENRKRKEAVEKRKNRPYAKALTPKRVEDFDLNELSKQQDAFLSAKTFNGKLTVDKAIIEKNHVDMLGRVDDSISMPNEGKANDSEHIGDLHIIKNMVVKPYSVDSNQEIDLIDDDVTQEGELIPVAKEVVIAR